MTFFYDELCDLIALFHLKIFCSEIDQDDTDIAPIAAIDDTSQSIYAMFVSQSAARCYPSIISMRDGSRDVGLKCFSFAWLQYSCFCRKKIIACIRRSGLARHLRFL